MTPSPDFTSAASESRIKRDAAHDALSELEQALASPVPGREGPWRAAVVAALDDLVAALDRQSESDLEAGSLLDEIGLERPRLISRIHFLHGEHRSLRVAVATLRDRLHATGDTGDRGVDHAEVREQLSDLGRRYRRHRAHEADLVYEATNVDLGGGD